MKIIIGLCLASLLAIGAFIYRSTRPALIYGEFIGAPRAEVSDLVDRPKQYKGKTVAVEGIIQEQCESMGCFFFFHSGEKILRIDLAQIAMYAPRKRNGRPARVEGQIVPFNGGTQLWASAVEFK